MNGEALSSSAIGCRSRHSQTPEAVDMLRFGFVLAVIAIVSVAESGPVRPTGMTWGYFKDFLREPLPEGRGPFCKIKVSTEHDKGRWENCEGHSAYTVKIEPSGGGSDIAVKYNPRRDTVLRDIRDACREAVEKIDAVYAAVTQRMCARCVNASQPSDDKGFGDICEACREAVKGMDAVRAGIVQRMCARGA